MKKIFVLLSLAVMSSIATFGQISFSYDLAGNRVKREIVMSKFAPKNTHATGFTESLAEKNIRIYPNPTNGHLKVEVVGYKENDDCRLQIFNATGIELINTKADSFSTVLDISSQPNGIYILHISLNGKKTNWKIIKK